MCNLYHSMEFKGHVRYMRANHYMFLFFKECLALFPMKEVCTYSGLSALIVCSLGELKDVTMTTTFKRHVELLEVIEYTQAKNDVTLKCKTILEGQQVHVKLSH